MSSNKKMQLEARGKIASDILVDDYGRLFTNNCKYMSKFCRFFALRDIVAVSVLPEPLTSIINSIIGE